MKPWHWSRIKFIKPGGIYFKGIHQAPAGNWVFFFIAVRNSDPKSPFRETRYACETLGL
ncbi:hypothetical protein [Mesorhizobium sp. M1A.F.Ca.ET.072.01.1.1]|uniref:hypothetical protein n=1 Tax=Mesorhizobium sp. M1A.F.Ca.ET.072.01.1.1 TaxID=2496753 RepID=UPI0016763137|nr:hypothetical protein [Mesorhizobium sp. M1A.F.Ca.ET.072.01.1.1]